jgi:hypothetical protein
VTQDGWAAWVQQEIDSSVRCWWRAPMPGKMADVQLLALSPSSNDHVNTKAGFLLVIPHKT